jgi:hypothetical protein
MSWKKLLDSSVAVALASGFLFCLGRSYQESFLEVYGLEPSQFVTTSARTLMAGFSVFYYLLLSLVPFALLAFVVFVGARYAQKLWPRFQKAVSIMMSPVRRYRTTFVILGGLLVFFRAMAFAERSSRYAALQNLPQDQHPLPIDRKDDDYVTRETLRLKNNPENKEIVGWLVAENSDNYAFYESQSRTVWLVRKDGVQSITLTVKDVGGREVLGNHR